MSNEVSLIPPPSALNYLVTSGADRDEIIITADRLSFGGFHFKDISLNLSLLNARKGPLGLDQGTQANSTWYYPHLLTDAKGTRLTGILSTSATSPLKPADYPISMLGGSVYNNAAGDLYRLLYRKGWWWWDEANNVAPIKFLGASIAAATWTTASPLMPSTSKLLKFTALLFCNCVGDDYVAVRPKGSNWAVGPAIVERQRSIAAGTWDGGAAERPTDDNGDLEVYVPQTAPLVPHLHMTAFHHNPFA